MRGSALPEWLPTTVRPLLPAFRDVALMSFVINMLALASPIFVMQVYDRVVFHAGVGTLAGLAVGMGVVVVFDYALRRLRADALQAVALRIDVDLGRRLFGKLVGLPLLAIESRSAAEWRQAFLDVDAVRNTLSGASAVMACDLPFVLLFLLLIFVIAQPIAWVIVALVPLFVLLAWRSARLVAASDAEESGRGLARDALLGEIIAGRAAVKAAGLDRALRSDWEIRHAEAIDRALARGRRADGYAAIGAALAIVTTVAMTSIGALAVIDQRLSIGALIAANMLSGRLIGPLNQLIGNWRVYSGFLRSARRLDAIFSAPSDRSEPILALPRPRGALRLEGVRFAYPGQDRAALDDVDLSLEAPGMVGVVGRNGSGKSTLLKLLLGLYPPSKGRVLLDGADIRQFSRPELAGWIGFAPQEATLVSGAIRDNIASRDPEAGDDVILAAARDAGVFGFATDLPDGFATDVGEAGARLSAGQRQRVAIARALLGDPPIVLLDEPSSHLDHEAQLELRRTLQAMARTQLLVVVTHSPPLLAACSTIVVLDAGRVVRCGGAADVLPALIEGARPRPRPPEHGAPSDAPAAAPGRGAAA